MSYELPNILEVAEEHDVTINSRTYGKVETLSKCPFCQEDSKPGKEKKYYLSLNTQDQVFRCWFCGEAGGVFRFMSLLTNKPEQDVIQEWQKKSTSRISYKPHPVERLTLSQLRLLGYKSKPNWFQMRKRDRDYYKRTRDFIWNEWREFIKQEKRNAYLELLIGIRTFSYQKSIETISIREKEIGVPLLKEVLKLYSLPKRPGWCDQAQQFLDSIQKQSQDKGFDDELYQTYNGLVEEVAEVIGVELREDEVRLLCSIVPELPTNLEGVNLEILYKIQVYFAEKYPQLAGEKVC